MSNLRINEILPIYFQIEWYKNYSSGGRCSPQTANWNGNESVYNCLTYKGIDDMIFPQLLASHFKDLFFIKINIPVNEVQFKSIKGKTPRFLYWSSSVNTQRWFIHHSEVPGHLAQFFNVINWGTLCCLQCEITVLWLCIETWSRKGGGSKLIDWTFKFCYDLEI